MKVVVAFPADVLQRLVDIEVAEGVPPLEVVHTAVAIFSYLNGDERRRLGQAALGLLLERAQKGMS
jgi:hypothetical protein